MTDSARRHALSALALMMIVVEVPTATDVVKLRGRLEGLAQDLGCVNTAVEMAGEAGKTTRITVWCRRMKETTPGPEELAPPPSPFTPAAPTPGVGP